MNQVISIVAIISLIVAGYLFIENKDLKEINEKQQNEIVALQQSIAVAEEAREAYDAIDSEYKERIAELEKRQNRLSQVLARTDFANRAREDAEGLEESINSANDKWLQDYNNIGKLTNE